MRALPLLALSLLPACGHREEVSTVAPTAPVRKVAPPRVPQQPPAPPIATHAAPTAAPHGAGIAIIALADEGDVAFTADRLGELRLWPSLDGTRPPVVVPGQLATALAIGHAGDGLVAAIRDESGGLEIVRLARDGAVLGRTQVRDAAMIEDVVAIGGGVLALRADQTIARYDASGVERGQVAPSAGQRVIAIAARRGGALAVIAGEPDSATTLRWLALDGDGVHWGASLALPDTIGRAVALSPDHRRLVAQLAKEPTKVVAYELAPAVRRVDASPVAVSTDHPSVGFSDNDRFAVAEGAIGWHSLAKPVNDPWAGAASTPVTSDVAIADGRAITALDAMLVIADPAGTHYLGYRELPGGMLSVASLGAGFTMQTGMHSVWLDEHLGLAATASFDRIDPKLSVADPMDNRHAIVQRRDGQVTHVELMDLQHPNDRVEVFASTQLAHLHVSNELGMLAVDETNGDITRFRVDLAHDTVTRLPTLASQMVVTDLHLLDPKIADGMVAVMVGYKQDKQGTTGPFFLAFRDGASAPAITTKLDNAPLAIDARGTAWNATAIPPKPDEDPAQPMFRVVGTRGGGEVAHVDLGGGVASFVTDRAGERFAVMRPNEVAMYDAQGRQLWQRTMLGLVQVVLSGDERAVVVRTQGGLVELDAATGNRTAIACGWAFGIFDAAPQTATTGAPPVCVDESV